MTAPGGESTRSTAPAGGGAHLLLLVCMLAAASLGAWASYGMLDVVSVATGEVIPSSQVKTVQHLEGGIVREILVREGERVERGQPVVNLEPTVSGANVDEILVRITSLRIDLARLEAEAEGKKTPVFPEDLVAAHGDLVEQAKILFEARTNRYSSDVTAQREAIVQRQAELTELKARLKNDRARLELINEQVKISEKLLKDDLTNRYNHINLLRETNQLESRIEEGIAGRRRAGAALKEVRIGIERLRHAFQADVHRQLELTRRDFDEATQRLRRLEDSLKRTVVRSPVGGIVKTLHVVTEGGVVQPGGGIVDIVPVDDRLIIEAGLPTHDIGYVRVGQPAVVKLASPDAMRFGKLDGNVIHISPDTFVSDQGVPYYKVRIATERDSFHRGELEYRLYPGMQVVASIKTGQRSVAEYLMDPFMDSIEEAMREP